MMKLRHPGLLMGILLLGLLAACGTGSAPPGGDPLKGTAWSLASINGAAPLTGTMQTLTFSDGRISGSGGCNSYGGTYSLEGGKIQIKDMFSTLMACMDPQGLMDQEASFFNSLGNAQSYQVNKNSLQIHTTDGTTLDFVPAR